MAPHLCHARRCTTPVPPAMLMCAKHWRALPRDFKVAVQNNYSPGQETRRDPTREYLRAAMACIDWVDTWEREQLR